MKKERWEEVNALEKQWWIGWKSRVDLNGIREELIKRAEKIKAIIDKYYLKESIKILQIGPAANGEVHFLSGERFAIDPLASFFKINFSELIDPDVKFIDGLGENMPYESDFFDVVLILNVLDHCFDPEKVLKEIFRCLKIEGMLILDVNTYNSFASLLHHLFGFLDKEHPYAITRAYLKKSFKQKYEILEEGLFQAGLPAHFSVKRIILLVLRLLKLSPKSYRLVARKIK